MPLDLQKSRWTKIYINELEFMNRIDDDSWTQEGAPNTNCWWIAYSTLGKPARVEEDGVDYSEEASLVDCHASASSWFWDSGNNRLYVHSSGSDDPGGASYIILVYHWEYVCNQQLEAPYEIVYNGHWYDPRLDDSSISDVTMAVSDFYQGGVVQTFGSVKWKNEDKYFDQRIHDYIYHAAKFIQKVGEKGTAYGDLITFLRGWTRNIIGDDNNIEIQIGDMREKFG